MLSFVRELPVVTSRYDSAAEVSVMQEMLLALAEPILRRIESVFCDSKACACYGIELNDSPTQLLAELIDEAFLKVSEGHNGIWLHGPGNSEFVVAPNWKQDW